VLRGRTQGANLDNSGVLTREYGVHHLPHLGRPISAWNNNTMTVLRGFVITLGAGVAFAVLGALGGYLLGTFVPDYYRLVLQIRTNDPVDLAQAGLGMGLTQGGMLGLAVGLVIVVAVAWHRSRVAVRP
jgi:hypothetical protein